MKEKIDLSDQNEPKGTFVLEFRKRKDGRASSWYCRLRLSEKERLARQGRGSLYTAKALQAANKNAAMKEAIEWRRTWGPGNKKRAQLANIPSFGEAADRWLVHERQKAERVRAGGQRGRSTSQLRRWETSVRRYLKPVFADLPVNEIALADAERWASWRERYYVDGPGADEIKNAIEYVRNGKVIRRPAQARAKISKSTVAKDADAFTKVISFSRSEYPHLTWGQPISLRKVAQGTDETERRERFDRNQRKHIFEVASVRAHGPDFEDYEDPPFNREVLYNLIRFLWCTGLRVAEVKLLEVRHVLVLPTAEEVPVAVPTQDPTSFGYDGAVDEFTQDMAGDGPFYEYEFKYKFRVDWVKRKSHRRDVVPRLGIYNVMQRHLVCLGKRFGSVKGIDWSVPPATSDELQERLRSLPRKLPLFPNENGGVFSTMDRMHNRVLENTHGVDRDDNGDVFKRYPDGLREIDGRLMSLSCWRHTYASEMLEYFMKRQNPNLVNWLALNMGTSPAMIHRHYAHILAQDAEKDLAV